MSDFIVLTEDIFQCLKTSNCNSPQDINSLPISNYNVRNKYKKST